MKLKTFARLAPHYFAQKKCAYLRSPPGYGKTSTILDLVPRLSQITGKRLGISIVSGPNLQPGDTVGFGIPKHNEGYSEMVFTLPFFMRSEEGKLLSEYDGGVLFIDEADKMDVDIKKVVGEGALSGRFGPHRLPPGWVVWMAGNRAEDRSGSTKELDHLISRRFEIDIEPDIEGWEEWAHKSSIHPSIIAFAVSNPQIVFSGKVPEKQGPSCNPRSLVSTGELLASMADTSTGNIPTDTDAIEIASGGIGQAAAGQLFATLRLESELPAIQTIINNPGAARLPTKPDAQMLVCYKLASLSSAENLDPVITYIERLPADFAATYAKAVITRAPTLISHKAMLDWVKRNNTLMTTLSMLKTVA
jgi:hypothetical protein